MNLPKRILGVALAAAVLSCNSKPTNMPANTETSAQTNTALLTLFDARQSDASKLIEFVNAYSAASDTSSGLHVTFESHTHANSQVVIKAETAWDWSQFEDFNIAFDIANPGKHSVQLYLDITDIDGATYTRTVSVPVASNNTYYAKMAGHDLTHAISDDATELNFVSGLRSNPDTWASDEVQFTSMWGKKNLNLKGIAKISLKVSSALFNKEIILSNIRLRTNPPMDLDYLNRIVDKFGQNARVDFPGKVHSLAELHHLRDRELAGLKQAPPARYSRWGGWLDGPKLKASGFFRTEKYQGKWSLVDPDGYLYFATGLDIIRLANSSTMTGYDFKLKKPGSSDISDVTPEDSEGLNRINDGHLNKRYLASALRKDLFEWLPSYQEPLGKHYGYRNSAHSGPLSQGETYSFYSANLERKYADLNPDYTQKWRQVTVDRMLNWGFTSLGNWTDPSFYNNKKIPYFANGWIIGDFKTVSSGNDFWAPLPDVFDPEFAKRTEQTVKAIANEVQNSPWCVGVFIDNEKSFGRSESDQARYGIVIHTLQRSGLEVPTKQAFTKLMRDKYQNISALNQAWGTAIHSWQDFNLGIDSHINTKAQLNDYSTLLYAYADKYFATVDKALEKYLPNTLYLGARFPDWGKPIEVVKASAKYVDVISYNVYKEGLHPQSWQFLADIDMPSIIGEFHIGANDSGLFHPGLIHAANQQDRAKMYQDYMHSVIDNPYFIGAHWFQYMDSPITGRAYDGENYNVGFVNVTDTPYQPMVDAAKAIHGDMYQRRFKSIKK